MGWPSDSTSITFQAYVMTFLGEGPSLLSVEQELKQALQSTPWQYFDSRLKVVICIDDDGAYFCVGNPSPVLDCEWRIPPSLIAYTPVPQFSAAIEALA